MNLDLDRDMELEELLHPKKNYWDRLVNSIGDFKDQIQNKSSGRFQTSKPATNSSYLFDPHVTLQRSYGAFSRAHGHGDDDSSPEHSRSSSNQYSYSFEVEAEGGQVPVISAIQIVTDDGITETTHPLKSSSALRIPSINIELERQDMNFLTVDTSGGGLSPGGRTSGFVSGAPSPTPTTGSSFEFHPHEQLPDTFSWKRILKIFVLVALFCLVATLIITTSENHPAYKLITASQSNPYEFPLQFSPTFVTYYPILTLLIKGAFVPSPYQNYTTNRLTVEIQSKRKDGTVTQTGSEIWEVPIFSARGIGLAPESELFHGFNLKEIDLRHDLSYSIVFRTNTEESFPFSISGRLLSEGVEVGAIFGGIVMIGLYILIIFELVHRTLAAMLAAAASIAALAAFNERPTTEEMVSWLDMETLILLFSMMVIVAILCETGFFHYASFLMYKLANGQVWPLITGLCFFTAIVSAFLDNVTTILLMTPVTIRICEAMELNPVPVLISIVIFSNMGGAVTPVGDPPNVIISNNKEVIEAGIDFATFSLHMLLGVIPVLIVAYVQLRIMFRSMKSLKFSEPYEIAELRREIDVWSRAADSLSSYSRDESHVKALLLSKVIHLQNKLKVKVKTGGQSIENYRANLIELEASCKIRDWVLLAKCGVVLFVVIMLFFLHSIPELNLSMGWTALLGAVFLLILADRRELEGIFNRVEWSTLIFFSALFVVMEGVSRLGLLEWIGKQTEEIISEVGEDSRLTVAILLILWVSGIASAFIDNIPFTTVMIKIVTRLSDNLALPLPPLIWALALGTCLGGNGTLIGASANVVAAGVADQHGYKFTFTQYFKIGFPMMLVSMVVSTVYLVICHTFLEWNY